MKNRRTTNLMEQSVIDNEMYKFETRSVNNTHLKLDERIPNFNKHIMNIWIVERA